MQKQKQKTKKELEIEVLLLEAMLKFADEQVAIKHELKEAVARDVIYLQKVILDIGSVILGPNWISHKSYSLLLDAAKDLKISDSMNAGMFHSILVSYRELLGKISDKSVDKSQV